MLIHELVSSKILPAMRGILAHKLSSAGISQRKIANYLEVTQPMISKILRKPLEEYYAGLAKLGLSRDFIEHYVNILVEIAISEDYERFISTTFTVVNQLALRAICGTRKDLIQLCITGVFRDPEIEYYKGLLFTVLTIRGLEKLIPEVGSNLAYAPRTPKSVSDIIGLTGRIIKIAGGVTFYGEPAYGGSRHVARVLLMATKSNPKLKFCFNVKCAKRVKNTLAEMGMHVVDTGPHLREDDFWVSIEKALLEKPQVVCDFGGLGLEPVAYIFAESFHQLESYLKNIVGGIHEP
ncbi:MAG: thiamine-phosphate synthase family protein [Desulfurococcaceae archaeon]